MSKAETYEEFFEENVKKINVICGRIIGLVIIAPILLIISVKLGFFYMPINWLILFSCFIIPFAIFQNILIRKCNNQRFNTYFTLFGLEILVVFLGSNGYVNIYISCALIPFISCLYFNRKLTNIVTIYCYIGMLVSLWFKSQVAYTIVIDSPNPVHYFIAYGIGFSIEYIFVFAITNAITKRCCETLESIYASNKHIRTVQRKIISSFANLVESRDSLTGEHIKRTTKYVELISRELLSKGLYANELTEKNIELYINAAPLHDLGKLHVPDYILCKPSKLTTEEYEKMKIHPTEGESLIQQNLTGVESEEYVNCARIMSLYHHEKWDGTGYPNGVSRTDIPLCARIMAAADVLDALLSRRQYKEPMSIDKAMSIFLESRGTHFEPCIVDAVINCKDRIYEIANE